VVLVKVLSKIVASLVLCSLLVAVFGGVSDAAVVANREKTTNGCTVHLDDPHLSDYANAGGQRLWSVVAKTRVTCSRAVTFVDLGMLLFWCPFEPYGPEETWSQYGCRIVATQDDLLQAPAVNETFTRQVSDNAPQSGHYVACTQYVVTDSSEAVRDNVWSISVPINVEGSIGEVLFPPAPPPSPDGPTT
jgi:hypothetical protein